MASTLAGSDSLTADEKFQLITRGLQEVLKPEIIHDVLTKEERPLVIYWGKFSIPSLFLPARLMHRSQALQPLEGRTVPTSCP